MIVIGLDENGLGPALGPMVIVAAAFSAPHYDESRFWSLCNGGLVAQDSKLLFKPGKLKKAETAVGHWLSLFGTRPVNNQELESAIVVHEPLPCPADGHRICRWSKIPLPQWGGIPADHTTKIIERFEKKQIKPVRLLAHQFCPGLFNKKIESGNKLFVDFTAMISLVTTLSAIHPNEPVLALCGKVGGTTAYGPWFDKLGMPPTVIQEERQESVYVHRHITYKFIKDSDQQHLPVAVASMVGKYLRELSMLELNRLLRWTDRPISGYHDKRTRQFIEQTQWRRQEILLPSRCFLRNK